VQRLGIAKAEYPSQEEHCPRKCILKTFIQARVLARSEATGYGERDFLLSY